ncbi:Na+/H+ antiporter subunit E [Aliiglaciecola sp. CAU 1673]|uniref:Na+/H+ antiporter subunit E n=1 Tax=Aliiglaciecola sp. CAU 1673 TaxID=3032595 RepID=UPI0023DA5B6C|nr:Na+/H+ antiporter subunit E [Aliiglaciecola sp. CAU 1673]MDF2179839.1 Na+/H+ antiporter subunit E [Aliiglaciecola sp. CAU 1673]
MALISRYVGLAVVLLLLWWLLSGHHSVLMLSLGLLSVCLTLLLVHRMGLAFAEGPQHISHARLLYRLPLFWTKLFWLIVLSNLDMLLRLMGIRRLSPQTLTLELPFRSQLCKAIYANAITLTPGTASLELSEECLVVHYLSVEHSQALQAGHLAILVSRLEEKD